MWSFGPCKLNFWCHQGLKELWQIQIQKDPKISEAAEVSERRSCSLAAKTFSRFLMLYVSLQWSFAWQHCRSCIEFKWADSLKASTMNFKKMSQAGTRIRMNPGWIWTIHNKHQQASTTPSCPLRCPLRRLCFVVVPRCSQACAALPLAISAESCVEWDYWLLGFSRQNPRPAQDGAAGFEMSCLQLVLVTSWSSCIIIS